MSHEPEFESQGTSPPSHACGHPRTPENTAILGGCRACMIKPPRFRRHNHPRVPENMTSAGRCLTCRRVVNASPQRAEDGWKRQGHDPAFTWADYQRMLRAQGGRCKVCRRLPKDCQTQGRKRLDDHDTGKVRGLLCNPCNRIVMLFEDGMLRRPDFVEQAREYLEEQAA